MTRATVVAALVGSMALLATSCGGSAQAALLPGLTATKVAKLKALVASTGKANGDAHPSSAMVFASRRHEANIAAGAGTGVQGSQPVYLIVIHGHFVCSSCSGPSGSAPPPAGDVITLVVDRTTLQGLDFGIGDHPDTSRIGPGLPLQLP